jgi:hypothetical protein
MSATISTSSKIVAKPTSPAKVLLLYIAGLLMLLVVSPLVFELELPWVGKTLWDAILNGVSWRIESLFSTVLPVLAAATADHFTFLTSAVGVLWLTHIHLGVSRSGGLRSGKVDCLMIVLATWLYAVYWLCMGPTMNAAGFYARLALYSSISTVVFSLTAVLAWRTDAMGDGKRTPAQTRAAEENMGPLLLSLVLSAGSGLATGFYSGDDTSVSVWAYQIPNALMHLAANAAGVVMALWFVSLVSEQAQAKSAVTTGAVAGAHTQNPAG